MMPMSRFDRWLYSHRWTLVLAGVSLALTAGFVWLVLWFLDVRYG